MNIILFLLACLQVTAAFKVNCTPVMGNGLPTATANIPSMNYYDLKVNERRCHEVNFMANSFNKVAEKLFKLRFPLSRIHDFEGFNALSYYPFTSREEMIETFRVVSYNVYRSHWDSVPSVYQDVVPDHFDGPVSLKPKLTRTVSVCTPTIKFSSPTESPEAMNLVPKYFVVALFCQAMWMFGAASLVQTFFLSVILILPFFLRSAKTGKSLILNAIKETLDNVVARPRIMLFVDMMVAHIRQVAHRIAGILARRRVRSHDLITAPCSDDTSIALYVPIIPSTDIWTDRIYVPPTPFSWCYTEDSVIQQETDWNDEDWDLINKLVSNLLAKLNCESTDVVSYPKRLGCDEAQMEWNGMETGRATKRPSLTGHEPIDEVTPTEPINCTSTTDYSPKKEFTENEPTSESDKAIVFNQFKAIEEASFGTSRRTVSVDSTDSICDTVRVIDHFGLLTPDSVHSTETLPIPDYEDASNSDDNDNDIARSEPLTPDSNYEQDCLHKSETCTSQDPRNTGSVIIHENTVNGLTVPNANCIIPFNRVTVPQYLVEFESILAELRIPWKETYIVSKSATVTDFVRDISNYSALVQNEHNTFCAADKSAKRIYYGLYHSMRKQCKNIEVKMGPRKKLVCKEMAAKRFLILSNLRDDVMEGWFPASKALEEAKRVFNQYDHLNMSNRNAFKPEVVIPVSTEIKKRAHHLFSEFKTALKAIVQKCDNLQKEANILLADFRANKLTDKKKLIRLAWNISEEVSMMEYYKYQVRSAYEKLGKFATETFKALDAASSSYVTELFTHSNMNEVISGTRRAFHEIENSQ